METYLPPIFALLVAAAGWYYLFYSKAAGKLATIEGEHSNRLRIRLRRACGVVIILLAVAFYAMFVYLQREEHATAGLLLMAVMLLMFGVVVLGLIDLRLTRRMRARRGRSSDVDRK
jgi:UDP-N-acetylmuramyl pentapeptide phosphotransferase/UDP-N-acetylglucosamine-1-phosphate transferase